MFHWVKMNVYKNLIHLEYDDPPGTQDGRLEASFHLDQILE